MNASIHRQTSDSADQDYDDLLPIEAPSFPYPNEEERLRIFFASSVEAKAMFDEKIAEWLDVAREARRAIKHDLMEIGRLGDKRSRWFWTEALKISPAAKQLTEARRQISRLRRLKRAADRVFKVGDEGNDTLDFDIVLTRAKQIPILDVISRVVDVKKAGKAYIALCPFHDDKQPSLHVYPATNSFYCFGCQRGGDAIEFVRLRFGYGFKDAIEYVTKGEREDERQCA
jgi:hypothetical protein